MGMMIMVSSQLAAALLLYVSGAHAFWRMNCAIIQRGRIDPLVNPGAIAAHAHTIIGGSNIGVNATYNTLLQSQCTSCEIAADKSAYWTPTLYYNYPNGSFLEVPHSGAVAYYLGRGPNAAQTIPYPKGLMILSGDKSARSYDNQTYTWGNATYPGRLVADRVSFACLDSSGSIPEQPYMFRTQCSDGLRAQIHFQSCWDGHNLYKSDNSHVAYQSQIDNGICPDTHPHQIPHLFLETLYGVAQVPDQNLGGQFVFSQGDPTGYGMHGDFQNGWETDVLANAVQNCLSTDNDGQISECPVLQATQSNGYPYNCPERPAQINETVTGLIAKLPGCITITPGPAAAPASAMNCAAGVQRPVVTSTVNSNPLQTLFPVPGSTFGTSSYQKYVGCFSDAAGDVRTLNAISTTNYTIMTVEYCQTYCNSQGYRLSGLEYGQECHCDNAIDPYAVDGSDQCTWNCGGTMTTATATSAMEVCGGIGYISIYNNTDPSFNANGSLVNSAGAVQAPQPLSRLPSNYVGCATDNFNGVRTLAGPSTHNISMTTALCQAYCQQGSGYQYFGTEYGTQCYCGNTITAPNYITTSTTTVNKDICNMRCSGAGDQLCGGGNALSVYNNTAYIIPKVVTKVGKYLAKQCLTDPLGPAGRALQGAFTTNPSMTVQSCIKFCLGKYFRYAGIEYGQECYCGNSIATSTGARQTICPVSSMTTCGGNVGQYCGGSLLMSLYYTNVLL